MVLKRSSMKFPWFSRRRVKGFAPPLKGEFAASSSGGAALRSRQRKLRRAAVERRQPRLAERSIGCHQPSPTGSARSYDGEVEREMGEDVADGAERGAAAAALSSTRCREARPSRRAAPWRAAHQPDLAVALDPPGGAVAMRPRLALAPRREGFGLSRSRKPRNPRAAGIRRSAAAWAGRSSRRGPSSPG